MEQRWKVKLLIESEGDPTACICCGKVWWLLCVCVCVCACMCSVAPQLGVVVSVCD